jgi:hypothetical protein
VGRRRGPNVPTKRRRRRKGEGGKGVGCRWCDGGGGPAGILKGYGTQQWREDLKRILRLCGLEQREAVFLFTDTQIVKESFLEDVAARGPFHFALWMPHLSLYVLVMRKGRPGAGDFEQRGSAQSV